MVYVCAWCDAALPYQATGDVEEVSHGICLDCVAGMLSDLAPSPEAIKSMTATLAKVGYRQAEIRAKFGIADEEFIGGTP